MRSFFKRDSFLLGIGMAIVIPVIVYFLLKIIVMISGKENFLQNDTMQLIAVFSNLLPFRYYLVRIKADKTGRGILLITMVLAFVYFYFNIQL